MLNNKAAILGRQLPYIDVQCPGLDEIVRVQAMSVRMHNAFIAHKDSLPKDADNFDVCYVYLIYSIVDETGHLVFTPEDAESLANLQVKDIELLFEAAQKINGMLDDEEAVKKS